jgi:translation elongation factor EF-1alpha
MFHKTVDRSEPGDQLGLLLRGLDTKMIRRGCVIVPQNHNYTVTDKVMAQVLLIFFYKTLKLVV